MPVEEESTSGWIGSNLSQTCTRLPENVNVLLRGRGTRSPAEGFGGLRLRTYSVRLPGVDISPKQVFDHWLTNFSSFWQNDNYFIPCEEELSPGVIAAILLTMPAGIRVVTGARVLYLGDTSMTLETLAGHMFAGWITFSAFSDDGEVVIQTQALVRPGDLLYELSFLLGFGQHAENTFWHGIMLAVAQQFGVNGTVTQQDRVITRSFQWRYFGNIWYNAVIRSLPGFFGRSFRKILDQMESATA
jgi:hypothetical protein